MVDTVNLALYRWSTFRQRLNVIDENALQVNLTGYGAKLQIRASYGDASALFTALETDYLTPGNGYVDIEFPGDVIGPWAFSAGVYDLFVTEPVTALPIAIAKGTVMVTPSVTIFP
jgi:hypothetical protein